MKIEAPSTVASVFQTDAGKTMQMLPAGQGRFLALDSLLALSPYRRDERAAHADDSDRSAGNVLRHRLRGCRAQYCLPPFYRDRPHATCRTARHGPPRN